MSNIEELTHTLKKQTFPTYRIERQFYININGQKLFFDFKIEPLKLLIEVQGEQHDQFSKYFHGNKKEFNRSKMRDKIKREWAEKEGYSLLYFHEDSIPNNPFELVDLIYSTKFEEGDE